jgi:hypothetical protein
MSLKSAAQRRDDPEHSEPYILVGESTTHQWVVKDSGEARALGCSVVVIRTGAVNLDCLD